MYNREYTPERIVDLKPNEIFVFGSNLAGAHGGGAARLAYNRFGAIWGQGGGDFKDKAMQFQLCRVAWKPLSHTWMSSSALQRLVLTSNSM